MKNYLFAPFKDDDDKIEEFHAVIRSLKYEMSDEGAYLDSALHGLRVFIGRLESYYDIFISKLQSENDELSGKLQEVNDDYNNDHKVHNEYEDGLLAEIKELKEENERLNAECWCGCNDDLKAEYEEMKRDNEELQVDNKRLYQEHKDCRSDAVKHYPKEYQAEAEEWFEHNPQDEKLFFFMVGSSDVDEDGDLINTLNVGVDAIAECDNYKGVISVETYE